MGTRDRNQNKQPAPRGTPRKETAARNSRTGQERRAPQRQPQTAAPRTREPERRPSESGGRKEKKRVYSARRHKYRKLKIGILYTVMILAILTAGIAIGVTVLFKIDTIQVVGESRYDPQEIIQLSGVEKGENLVTIDTQKGEAAIAAKMPYLESVRIKRQLPSTVNIEITEAKAAGCIAYDNQYVIINSAGKVLELAQAPLDGVPVIKGVVVKEAALSQKVVLEDETSLTLISEIEAARASAGLTPVTEFDLTNPVSPTITYDGRIIIKLGIPTDLEYKLQTAVAVLNSEDMKTAQRGTLDVSLAPDKGRSYFKPEYGASSQAASSTASSQEPASEPPPEPAADSQPQHNDTAGESGAPDSNTEAQDTGGGEEPISSEEGGDPDGQAPEDGTSSQEEGDPSPGEPE